MNTMLSCIVMCLFCWFKACASGFEKSKSAWINRERKRQSSVTFMKALSQALNQQNKDNNTTSFSYFWAQSMDGKPVLRRKESKILFNLDYLYPYLDHQKGKVTISFGVLWSRSKNSILICVGCPVPCMQKKSRVFGVRTAVWPPLLRFSGLTSAGNLRTRLHNLWLLLLSRR